MKKTKRDKTIKPARTENKEKPASVSLTTLSLSLLIICALAATAYQRNSIYHDFITLWGNITKTSPNKRRAHENYGQALSTVGRLEEALREFNTVLALKDDGSVPMRDLYREIGVVYFRMNRMADAISAWQTGLRHAPNDASLLNNLSIALLQTGRYEEAAMQAQTALSADPNLPQALNTMGQVLMLKKDYEKAVNIFFKGDRAAAGCPGSILERGPCPGAGGEVRYVRCSMRASMWIWNRTARPGSGPPAS